MIDSDSQDSSVAVQLQNNKSPSPKPTSTNVSEASSLLLEATLLDTEEEGDDSSIDLRSASLIHVAFVAFFIVSGGPIGLEQIIKAAGPFYSFLGLLIFPFIWAIPQALMTAEMSTMFASNGGYVVWCTRAFGAFGGWMNGFNAMFCNIVDVAMYPLLFVNYLEGLFPMSTSTRWFVMLGVILFVLFLNIKGVDIVGSASIFFFIIIISPFFGELATLLWNHQLDGSIIFKRQNNVDWAMYANILFWNLSGWTNLGCIAGEVSNPKKTYPLAVLIALAFMTVMYFFALFVGVCIDPDFAAWGAGHFVEAALNYRPWLGYWMEIGATVAALGMLNATMSSNSRAVWRLGKYHMLPEFAALTLTEGQSPVGAMLIHAGFCIALGAFDFEALLEINNFLFGISLVMQMAAFVYFKVYEPNTPRPFLIPGGIFGGLLVALPVFAFVLWVLFMAPVLTWLVAVGLNVIFVGLFIAWKNGWLAVVSSFWVPPTMYREAEAPKLSEDYVAIKPTDP